MGQADEKQHRIADDERKGFGEGVIRSRANGATSKIRGAGAFWHAGCV